MKPKQLRDLYFQFFQEKQHALIPSASLIPTNDPSVLFNTAGMQPLVPYLLGGKHPSGKKLVNIQKCLRTGDFENIGDNTHHTFFQMLGNWSLGDYFKKEAIAWSFEFLTGKKWLNIPLKQLAVTVYEGDAKIPRDTEAAELWQKLGVPKERVAFLGKDNFWSAGDTGPCGPSSEMFYWMGSDAAPKKFDPEDARWVEIWNDVFMTYNKVKRVILVDGMFTIYDSNFKVNSELLAILNSFNAKKILVVNGFREKGRKLLESGGFQASSGFEAFSLEEEKVNKDDPLFFETLFKKYNLSSEEVLYFDHQKENVDAAKKLGILSEVYQTPMQVNEFIEKNLFGFKSLIQKNVDTGMGFERALAVLSGKKSAYETELFSRSIKKIEELSGVSYAKKTREIRIIADHLRVAVFILGDENGVLPSNVDRGYVLRRLIRRAVRYGKLIGISPNCDASCNGSCNATGNVNFTPEIARIMIEDYADYYLELKKNKERILAELAKEEEKFNKTLEIGLKEFNKMAALVDVISGKNAFLLFQSYGFPLEITQELALEQGLSVDEAEFKIEFEKHQELSRTASAGMFKGGLSEHSPLTTRLHTATHLLNEALRRVISKNIHQRGSNITPERLRFDFNFDRKLIPEEILKVENEVNRVIKLAQPVRREEMSTAEAKLLGAEMEFGMKYPERVSVYFVGDYSKEFCGGPHVSNTKELGKFKITKEEACAAGVRRIKAILEEV